MTVKGSQQNASCGDERDPRLTVERDSRAGDTPNPNTLKVLMLLMAQSSRSYGCSKTFEIESDAIDYLLNAECASNIYWL